MSDRKKAEKQSQLDAKASEDSQLQSDANARGETTQPAKDRKAAHGQTGPKTERGKWHSKWNPLKHGRYAKSTLLPFEDEGAFKQHLRDIRAALLPDNYVEQQIIDEYAHALWRLQRQENRTAYERERILDKLTPEMMAGMLGLKDEYCIAAPDYLTDLKKKIPKSQVILANAAFEQYGRLMQGAKGITNFNLVWRQFPDLFNALGAYIDRLGSMRPLFTAGQKDLDVAWQQHPEELKQHLAVLSKELFYMASFNEFKPQIRLYMESWYFAQHHELKRLERDNGGLIAERKNANTMLEKLMQLRKTQYTLWAATPKELPIHGFVAPKEIGFRED
jgi:hypothetical protein